MTAVTVPRNVVDVIVIGGGTGGLTTAALLAKAGLDVLVLEAGDSPGGYARARHHGPYTFDSAVGTLSDPGLFQGLLEHLGVADSCALIPVDSLYLAVAPEFRYTAPIGDVEAFIEAGAQAVPQAGDEIRRFFELCFQVHTQAHALPQQASLSDLDRLAAELPMAFAYRKATVQDVLREHVTDPRARTLCGLGSLLLGLPPSRLSLQTFAQSIFTYVVDGGFLFRGGVQTMIDALVAAVQREGGAVITGSPVSEITVADGRASGVVLEDGRRLTARFVVSTADAAATFGHMLAAPHRPPSVLRKLGRLVPGRSAVVMHAATSLDLFAGDAAPLVLATGSDLEQSFAAAATGDPQAVVLRLPSLVDGSLAPSGEQVAAVYAYVGAEAEQAGQDLPAAWEARLQAAADRIFPGFAAATVHTELATPESFRDMAFDAHGACFGWELTPLAAGSARPAPNTPLPGLYLAGKWTQPGGCFLRSTVSGVFASQCVLHEAGLADVGQFHHGLMPTLD